VTAVAWQSAGGLGGHLRAGALKKPAKDTHLNARCVGLVSSSGLLPSFAPVFKTSNTSFI
jgi:hypothetical protein